LIGQSILMEIGMIRIRVAVAIASLLLTQGTLSGAQAPGANPRMAAADSLFNAKDFAGAAAVYDEMAAAGPLTPRAFYRAAAAHARLGHPDPALTYLDKSVTAGFRNLQILSGDASFASIRDDARYHAIEQRLKDAFTPCVKNPEAHKFDFWVGEWTVTTPAGQPAGSSSVQKILGDCVVFENWTDGQGGQGKSLNAFNSQLGQWQQFWTDQYGGVTEYRQSEWVGPSLRYTASGKNPQGTMVLTRMTFTPVDPNTVRQFGDVSTDDGKTWTLSFDLTYHRKK
jgi:hypothetical protein